MIARRAKGHPLELLGESICPYCGVGCRLAFERPTEGGALAPRVHSEDLRSESTTNLRVRGVTTAPANRGGICAKGAQLGPTIHTSDRLGQPQLRLSRHDDFRAVDWTTALRYMREIFLNILNTYGPDAIAFYGSGQLDTESVYLIGKLFKGHLGCNNTDSNSRLCMAAAVAGYRTSLGADGPPTCYDDIELADAIVIMGSNMAEAHPVTFDRIKAFKKLRPEQQIIVIDPRRTATAASADIHLAVAPGGDIALLNALGRMLLDMGGRDDSFISNHTRGFDEYRAFLLEQNVLDLCSLAGVAPEELFRVAKILKSSQGFLSFYCMGLNQSTVGMWKNNSLINLHLILGQIAKPGAGPFSLTGQPNAMGGREGGLLSHALPGYRTVENDAHRRECEDFWGRSHGTIGSKPGLTAVEMFRDLEKGKLKAIWIAGTNPAVSLPDLHQVRRALAKAQLVIVNDAYHPTETSRLADVILPAAQFGEKEWTSTNSERMVSFSPKLWDGPGEALPDWQIIARFAQTMGFKNFNYANAAEVWDEYIQLTTGRPCDMSGATSERLREETSLQWPCPASSPLPTGGEGPGVRGVSHPGTKRLYLDKKFPTPDGRANFLPRDHREPREVPDHEFPFVLTTGRLYSHWHTLTRTAKADKLTRREPGPFVEINPEDAAKLKLEDGDMVQVSSRRGTIQLPARLRDGVSPGMIFVPFHWGDIFNDGNAANYLTIAAIGRVAKQPELKFCAVNLEKVPQAKKTIWPLPIALEEDEAETPLPAEAWIS